MGGIIPMGLAVLPLTASAIECGWEHVALEVPAAPAASSRVTLL
jgi:hypothetical protein